MPVCEFKFLHFAGDLILLMLLFEILKLIGLGLHYAVVPKTGTVFMFQLDSSRVTLFGNNLFLRRLHAAKRQQTKQTIEL